MEAYAIFAYNFVKTVGIFCRPQFILTTVDLYILLFNDRRVATTILRCAPTKCDCREYYKYKVFHNVYFLLISSNIPTILRIVAVSE